MREVLSNMIANSAINDDNFILMSGDHGYALFDELRNAKPDSFLNVGIMEQGLVSFAAGMAKVGYKPMCYGLAAFLPMRVVEQIKFDVILPKLPVKFIGDGAGLVYTILGSSHQCAEDIGVLRTLPDIEIYAPGDPEEMRICYKEFSSSDKPAYLRVGKADSSNLNIEQLSTSKPYFTHETNSNICIISSGAMLEISHKQAKKNNLSHISVMKIKPIHKELIIMVKKYEHLIIIEEHNRVGGLCSAITDLIVDEGETVPKITSFSLNSSFTETSGDYQGALEQHNLSHEQIEKRIKLLI